MNMNCLKKVWEYLFCVFLRLALGAIIQESQIIKTEFIYHQWLIGGSLVQQGNWGCPGNDLMNRICNREGAWFFYFGQCFEQFGCPSLKTVPDIYFEVQWWTPVANHPASNLYFGTLFSLVFPSACNGKNHTRHLTNRGCQGKKKRTAEILWYIIMYVSEAFGNKRF